MISAWQCKDRWVVRKGGPAAAKELREHHVERRCRTDPWQAASRKPQAASRKPQAASRKPQAASRKPQAGHERLRDADAVASWQPAVA